MNVLITGAGGFIGSHVVRRVLRDGHSVFAVLRPGESTRRLTDCLDRLSLLQVDLRDAPEVRRVAYEVRPDCAIHLAWYAVPGRYTTAAENLDCVTMTLSLAQTVAGAGCKRLVAAGTCFEYDWAYGFLSEGVTPLGPRTLYGSCKNAARQVLQAYCAGISMGFAWTRFFYLYGPGEPRERLVPSVVLALLNGQTAKCTHGEQIRDFLYVEDVASAVWAVAQSDLSGPVNIGSGQPVKIRTLVEMIARLVGGSENVEFGAMPASVEEPPLLVADVRKLRAHTGWTPTRSLEDGLRQTVSWWQQNGE